MIRRLAVVAVAGAALTAFSLPAPAAAADQRPCVSRMEYQGMGHQGNATRAEVEARWEVAGLGRASHVPMLGRVITYPRCAYSRGEAWYGAAFDAQGLWATVAWRDYGATAHGHLRALPE